jgi:hypothetical protein
MEGRVDNADLAREGRSKPKIRPVGSRADGKALLGQARSAFAQTGTQRDSITSEYELEALGSFITLEAGAAAFPLNLEQLERWSRHRKTPKLPKWLLMSSQPATETTPETAVVWVSDKYRKGFLKLFEDYLTKIVARKGSNPKNWETPTGNPANRALVANIGAIRSTVLRDLWQSAGEPEPQRAWRELWLTRAMDPEDALDLLRSLDFHAADRATVIGDRTVVWVEAAWEAMRVLPFTSLPLAEIRNPTFVDTVEDLTPEERAEWVEDLATRVQPAAGDAPAVCHLDTGVARTHVLLAGSLAEEDLNTVVGESGFDFDGHGTKMAGIALFGNLDDALFSAGDVELGHRLESVRIMPSAKLGERPNDPLDYGTVTSQGVSTAEVASARRRVFCLPVSAEPDRPGDPTLWSATVDALCAGTDVVRDGSQLRLIGKPDSRAARLIVIAAGNTDLPDSAERFDPVALSDATGVADPAQAWNALTVGACTEMDRPPTDPAYEGWRPVASAGELSPHSRTSVPFSRRWPIKPDICMEGGNVLTDGTLLDPAHPALSVRTTGHGSDLDVASANATSAATAAAARLAALARAAYPDYWPETIRGLLTHSAEWTPAMAKQIKDKKLNGALGRRLALVRRYGWGAPTADAVLRSSRQAVTMVVQDSFTAFEGDKHKMRHFRLHRLPWPRRVLEAIGAGDVSLRVTLSYFVEPNPSRRGWRRRYAYASHALRFELKAPLETEAHFIARVNNSARKEETDDGHDPDAAAMPAPPSGNDRWLIGPTQRNTGSLHQDVWDGCGADLAPCDQIAVYPVGGWWKNNGRKDRVDLPVRYALLVSLTTRAQGVDLYTPIANELRVPTPVVIPG